MWRSSTILKVSPPGKDATHSPVGNRHPWRPLGWPAVFSAALIAAVAAPAAASADPLLTLPAPPFEPPFLPSWSGSWTVTAGLGGAYAPVFEGAKDGVKSSMLSPVPIFSIRRAGTAAPFRSPRDDPSIALIDFSNDFGTWHAGPVAKLVSARKADNFTELNGLGDVKTAYEVGGFVEYFPVKWLRTRIETRQGFGGHGGVTADLSADVIVPLMDRLIISTGPRFTYESTAATAPYFGVTAVQALQSGLPVFNAQGGAHSVGAGTQVTYRLTPQWEARSYVEYQRLLGDAAASPLVTLRGSRNQTTAGIGASYAFDIKIR
jgi:outer membrane protein